ncbi:MAG: HNH endonuclease [Pseudomonadota bacterium]
MPAGRRHCAEHAPAAAESKRERGRRFDAERRSAPWRKWYKTRAWKKARAAQLELEPLCQSCHDLGFTVPATVVDHIAPHRGDARLFFAPTNLQSLCKSCHDGGKQREERAPGGYQIPVGEGAGTGAGSQICAGWARGGGGLGWRESAASLASAAVSRRPGPAGSRMGVKRWRLSRLRPLTWRTTRSASTPIGASRPSSPSRASCRGSTPW